MDYDGYNERRFEDITDFEKIFSNSYVKSVASNYLSGKHGITMEVVQRLCRQHDLTYGQYQQLESQYLSKLSRRMRMIV